MQHLCHRKRCNLSQLSLQNLTQRQSQHLYDDMATANYIENIGDIIETNLVESGLQRLENNLEISTSTEEKFKALHSKVCWAVEQAIKAVTASDKNLATQIEHAKPEINRLALEVEMHLSNCLTAQAPNRLTTFRLESELIEYLKCVYYFAKRIAKYVNGGEMHDIRSPKNET